MFSQFTFARGARACFRALVLVLVLMADACGGDRMHSGSAPDALHTDTTAATLLAELDPLSTPQGADSADFAALKREERIYRAGLFPS